jgi:hypothetical protein
MGSQSFDSNDQGTSAVLGTNTGGGVGVKGVSNTYQGVSGVSTGNAGVAGESQRFVGVYGLSHDSNNAGVMGINDNGGWGVTGRSERNTGVSGESKAGIGVHGISAHLAGFFEGNVKVVGELYVQGNVRIAQGGDVILEGADCAEHFDIVDSPDITPGSVLVIGKDGALEESSVAYDRKVAGVVSGAGRFKPGIVLDKREHDGNRRPIALAGKVFCKVDANFGPIEVGDLLTTSPTSGHAMKAADPRHAFGALLGKALGALPDGRGLIPVLVALQ